MEMYIVLAITLFMMVMFIWNKVPFGVTTMTCCLLLAMFGIVCPFPATEGIYYS